MWGLLQSTSHVLSPIAETAPFIIWSGAGGVLGGAARGILRPTENIIRLGGRRQVHLGVWGDIAIGVIAAIAGSFVAESIVACGDQDLGPRSYLRLLGLSVVFGFAGASLLNSLARQLASVESRVDELQKDQERLEHKSRLLREANLLLAQGKFVNAQAHFERIEQEFGSEPESLIGLATCKFCRAIDEKMDTTAIDQADPALLAEAITLFETTVERHRDEEKGWYNLACARAACNLVCESKHIPPLYSKKEILDALREAIRLAPENALSARIDRDFVRLQDDEQFKELLRDGAAKARGPAEDAPPPNS